MKFDEDSPTPCDKVTVKTLASYVEHMITKCLFTAIAIAVLLHANQLSVN